MWNLSEMKSYPKKYSETNAVFSTQEYRLYETRRQNSTVRCLISVDCSTFKIHHCSLDTRHPSRLLTFLHNNPTKLKYKH